MPKKGFKKKKAFQCSCQEQIKKGKINSSIGTWENCPSATGAGPILSKGQITDSVITMIKKGNHV